MDKEAWINPVEGIITSAGGKRVNPITAADEFHNGVDIACSVGTPVEAVRSGTVLQSGVSATYGIFIRLSCGEYEILYAHLSKALVAENETVTQGQTVALSGNTGRSTGPHLHYGIFQNGQYINPILYLKNLPFTEEARYEYAQNN